MILNRVVGKVISLIKDDKYNLDLNLTIFQLMIISFQRFKQIVRGVKIKLLASKCKGIIFLGKNVVIQHGYLIAAKKGLILEDNVQINALSKKGLKFGANVSLGKQTIIACTGVIADLGVGIEIGNNTGINAQCYLGGQGGIKIGNDVIIGPGVKIFSENHNFNSPDLVIRKQGVNRKGVIIEDNCWIGAGSIILDGVTIKSGSIIAAGSVVTKDTLANSIAAGIPAKVIKSRINNGN